MLLQFCCCSRGLLGLLCAVAAVFPASSWAELPPHRQPVIGVLTIPNDPAADVTSNYSTIDASYVKWLEQGGAIVTPVLFNATAEEVTRQFRTLSGVLFTGGPAKPTEFTRYWQTEQLLLSLAREHAMPLWGTCLGFQSIADILAGTTDVLTDVDAEDLSLSLELTAAAPTSRLLGSGTVPDDVLAALTSSNYTTNWHMYGVTPETFAASLAVPAAGMVALSTNRDRGGLAFVSTMEHASLPIYATQWHPEANQFDRDHRTVDHSGGACATMQWLANFFVGEARSKGLGPGDVGPIDDVGTYPVRSIGTGYSAGLSALKYVFED